MTFITNIFQNSRMKASSWLAALFFVSGMLVTAAASCAFAQTATGPEQDCANALPVVRNRIIQQLSYSGAGQNATDLGMTPSCGILREVNSVWYRVSVGATGSLAFTITPNNSEDDYNFAAYRVPANTSGAADCLGLSNGVNFAACSFNPGNGVTGADNTLVRSFPGSFTSAISVSAGDVILLCVSNAGGRSGFTLDFSNSTAGVIPISTQQTQTTATVVTAVQTSNPTTGCSAPTVINLTFSQPVLRGSIQPSSFTIQSADGTKNYTITSVACSNCPSGNTAPQTFGLTISPAITESGVYRIATTNTASAVVARDIFNAPLVTQPQTFIVNVGGGIPAVQVDAATPSSARQSVSFCLGQSTTLTAEDGGTGSQYQWLRDNGGGTFTPIAGQTRRSLIFTGRYQGETLRGDGGDSVIVFIDQPVPVRVQITDQNGCIRLSTSINVTARGGRRAAISLSNGKTYGADQNPRVERICFADGITFTAEEGFRSYQWYFNGLPVDTGRNRTFFARALGNYTVETTDENGCLNKPAEILLETLSSSVPVISGPDVNCPNPTTGLITGTVTLTANNDPSYRSIQWLDFLNRPIAGANTNTLRVSTGTFSFRAITSEGCTVQVSKTVRPGQNPGIIRLLGQGESPLFICPGSTVTLQATSEYPSYRWYFNGSTTPIMGATQRTYTTNVAGTYQVQGVTADGCFTPLSEPPLTVEGATITVPTIRPAGGILRFCRGSSIDLSVDGGDNFEWFFQASQGAVREFLPTTRSINVNRPGLYTVRITFNDTRLAGCAVTSTATLVVVDNPMPVVINPASDSTFCQGGSLTLNAETGFETYQWLRNGTAIQGATMRSFVVTQTGNYSVRVTAAGGCSGTSGERSVRELPAPAQPIIGSSTNFLVCPNGASELRVTNETAGITYQWFRENIAIPNATGPRLTITQAGNYIVEARNESGCTSRPMSPSRVDSVPLPTPPLLPRTLVICPNASTTVDAGAGFMSYQWLRNGVVLMGETSRTLAIRSAGEYSVRVTNMNNCINTSATISVSQTAVNITLTRIDGGARFRATSVPAPQRFQWLFNGMNIPGAIDSIFAPTGSGSYNVRITDVNGCSDTARTVEFRIPVFPPPEVTCATAGAVVPCSPGTIIGSTGGTNSAGIGTPNGIAAPGDTIAFRFTLSSFGTLEPGARISADLCFNATMMEPLPPLSGGTITNGIRCIPVNFTLPANISDALLNALFRAALGNDSVTAVRLQNVRLLPSLLALPNSVGSFRLTNISYAGGARLIGPPPAMRLLPLAQNPTSDVASVGYTLENNSAGNKNTIPVLPVDISLSDVYGRVVKVSDMKQLIGSNGEIRMDVRDLVPGVYFMTVRTKDAVAVQRIHIIR